MSQPSACVDRVPHSNCYRNDHRKFVFNVAGIVYEVIFDKLYNNDLVNYSDQIFFTSYNTII